MIKSCEHRARLAAYDHYMGAGSPCGPKEKLDFTSLVAPQEKEARELIKQRKRNSNTMEAVDLKGKLFNILKLRAEEHNESDMKAQAKSMFPQSTRQFINDSGASFGLVDIKDLTTKEKKTIRKLQNPVQLQTANGEVTVTEFCTLYVP